MSNQIGCKRIQNVNLPPIIGKIDIRTTFDKKEDEELEPVNKFDSLGIFQRRLKNHILLGIDSI